MTFNKVVDRQIEVMNWIHRNLRPIKRFNYAYGRSMLLFRYLQMDIPDATHEEFKLAMSRAGYFADCQNCDDNYTKVVFNVSDKSIRKLRKRIERSVKDNDRGTDTGITK